MTGIGMSLAGMAVASKAKTGWPKSESSCGENNVSERWRRRNGGEEMAKISAKMKWRNLWRKCISLAKASAIVAAA
jgi:hypothetical protein